MIEQKLKEVIEELKSECLLWKEKELKIDYTLRPKDRSEEILFEEYEIYEEGLQANIDFIMESK